MPRNTLSVAILLPCHNEADAINKVVSDFYKACPDSTVYVYDNNSSDATSSVAQKAGAVVRYVDQQGKGHVVRHMFMEIDADIYIMADGDGTYDAASAPAMIDALVDNSADMVVGVRKHLSDLAYRKGHRFGNFLFNKIIEITFGQKPGDMLSGYRVFSRRFVKSFPVISGGFEIEAEITIHALSLQLRVLEVETPYYERAAGTSSKLRTFSDGFRILKAIALFAKDERPFCFFSLFGFVFGFFSILFGSVVVTEYIETSYVSHVPLAILATGLAISAMLCMMAGIILDSVSRSRKENKKLAFLAQKQGVRK